MIAGMVRVLDGVALGPAIWDRDGDVSQRQYMRV